MASIVSAGTTSATALNMSADTSGVLQLASNNGTVALTINTSQNIGIGVTPSASNLSGFIEGAYGSFGQTSSIGTSIAGNAVYNSGWKYKVASTATLQLLDSSGISWSNAPSGTPGDSISFTERMRIDSSGNLLVGTTSGVGSVGRGQFVQSRTDYAVISVDATSSSYVYNLAYLNTNTATGGGFNFIQCATGGYGTVVFRVRGEGNVYNLNNVYAAISDVKLKENITDATPKLAQLNQVRVVNYNLIGDTNKQLGVIAQELEQVFPAMVEETPDRDAEGNDLGTTTKSVKYSVFVPMLIKAIQELNAKVTALENK
jgi:hypothetical protein